MGKDLLTNDFTVSPTFLKIQNDLLGHVTMELRLNYLSKATLQIKTQNGAVV